MIYTKHNLFYFIPYLNNKSNYTFIQEVWNIKKRIESEKQKPEYKEKSRLILKIYFKLGN